MEAMEGIKVEQQVEFTECENVINIKDDSLQPKLQFQKMINRRSSFFRIDSPLEPKFRNEAYVERLMKETSEWGNAFKRIRDMRKL